MRRSCVRRVVQSVVVRGWEFGLVRGVGGRKGTLALALQTRRG